MRTTTIMMISKTALMLSLGSFAVTGFAGSVNDNLSVTADISANCLISAGGPVAFGAYDPIGTHKAADLDGTGTVTVTCTNLADWQITLGQGASADTGSTDAVPLRRMVNAGAYLSYFLYQDSGRTTVWGNETGSDLEGIGDGAAQAQTVYGRVTKDQQSKEGSYSDTVVATVTF